MKAVASIFVALFLLLGAAIPPAAAQGAYEQTPRQKEIIQTIMDAQSGYIDAALYEEYWTEIPFTAEERAWLVKEMRAFMFNGQSFSRESWASAEIALRTGSYTETDAYRQAKQQGLAELWSAVENAQNNQGLDIDDLKVTKIHVDAAPQFKRFGSKAKGRGTRIIKRNSHITVVVGDGKKDE